MAYTLLTVPQDIQNRESNRMIERTIQGDLALIKIRYWGFDPDHIQFFEYNSRVFVAFMAVANVLS